MLQIQDFEQAAKRLNGVVHKIPLGYSKTFSDMSGAEVYLKYENQQKTGSFKVRGAYNKIHKLHENGTLHAVIASSAGNHAQGVAYAAKAMGVKSMICMPQTTPLAKVAATKGYGAEVILHGNIYDDAFAYAMKMKEETGAVFIHPFDDDDVIAGQGTIAFEILSEMPDVDVIVVPAGGGGLISGIASCAKLINTHVKIVGVQASGAPAIALGFHKKGPVGTDTVKTIADGIAVKKPGDQTMAYINRYVDEMVTVTDNEIAEAILYLLERAKQVVEPAGAASVAAVLNDKIDVVGKKVVCILSGGNIDMSFISKIVQKGLLSRGRQMRFSTILPDIPGSLQKFAALLAEHNANILVFDHDRYDTRIDLNETIIHVVCEVGGPEHELQIRAALKQAGYQSLT